MQEEEKIPAGKEPSKDLIRIKGEHKFDILIAEQGYAVENYDPSPKDDLFCLIVARSIAESAKASLKQQVKQDPKNKFFGDRLSKVTHLESNLNLLVSDYLQLTIQDYHIGINKQLKELKNEQKTSDSSANEVRDNSEPNKD